MRSIGVLRLRSVLSVIRGRPADELHELGSHAFCLGPVCDAGELLATHLHERWLAFSGEQQACDEPEHDEITVTHAAHSTAG
jgi:hypothetical protein